MNSIFQQYNPAPKIEDKNMAAAVLIVPGCHNSMNVWENLAIIKFYYYCYCQKTCSLQIDKTLLMFQRAPTTPCIQRVAPCGLDPKL